MTTNPKAMPDEIENTLRCLELSWPTSGGKLRAHIAAQAEKIAELEKTISQLNTPLLAGQPTYEELEADNKRLRERWAEAESGRLIEVMRRKLSEPCENCDDTGLYSVGGIDNMPCPCKAALAQHDASCVSTEQKPEVCQTCGGYPIRQSPYMNGEYTVCENCNGTGRKP